MLPVQPKFKSATPVMEFTGQTHQGVLLGHIQSDDPRQYDTVLLVSLKGAPVPLLIISLEREVAGAPFGMVVYDEQGRQVLVMDPLKTVRRPDFVAGALTLVQQTLHDRLEPVTHLPVKPIIEVKTYAEFYPDPAMRLKLHYHFAHQWLPAYVRYDPVRFFGYFQRNEQDPTKFLQARWQMMEVQLQLVPDPAPAGMPDIIRRISDLRMTIEKCGDRMVALVEMPPPEQITRAFFVGLVLMLEPGKPLPPGAANVRVITLEKSMNHPTTGMVCEWSASGKHLNYAFQVPSVRENFVKAIADVLTHVPNVE